MLRGHKERAIRGAELGRGVTGQVKAMTRGCPVQDGCSERA